MLRLINYKNATTYTIYDYYYCHYYCSDDDDNDDDDPHTVVVRFYSCLCV